MQIANKSWSIWGLLFVTCSSLWAQSVPFGPVTDGVYLLAATPSGHSNATFGADLYRFDAGGRLVLVRTIVDTDPKKKEIDRGVDFVLADYDSRVLVIGSPNLQPNRLDLVLMDSPAAPVSRTIVPPALNGSPWVPWSRPVAHRDPAAPPTSMLDARLLENSGVKSIVLRYASDRGLLNVTIPLTAVGFGAPKYSAESDMGAVRVYGNFGLARLGYSDQPLVRTDRGRVVYPGTGGVGFDLGLPAPPALDGSKSINRWLMAHNKQMSVLWQPPANGVQESLLHVWTPNSAKWIQFQVPGTPPEFKGIGSWILGASSGRSNGRISPGQAERNKRAEKPKQRPRTDEWFQASDKYYPGTLFAIDTTSGKMITWQTGQGDSEILLIRGDSVIYRVNDILYSARIQGTTVGSPQLLAQDEAVPDMHWAFSSRQ